MKYYVSIGDGTYLHVEILPELLFWNILLIISRLQLFNNPFQLLRDTVFFFLRKCRVLQFPLAVGSISSQALLRGQLWFALRASFRFDGNLRRNVAVKGT